MKKILSIFMIALIGITVGSCVKDEPFPAPPIISGVVMAPLAPEANQPIVIRANVVDIKGVATVKLFYKINTGALVTVNMTKVGATNVYEGTIPGQPALTVIHYYIEAENIINKFTYSPATAPATPATFTVGGSVAFHYWHFNALPPRVDAPATVPSDFTFSGVGAASILYNGAFLDPVDPGTEIKAQMSAPAGLGLRVRSAYGDLIITAPSTGFRELEMSFALSRSGSGANTAEVLYSTNGGTTWTSIQTFSGFEGEPTWTGYELNLTSVSALNNNANLMFKIIPSGATGGNLRIDNIAILGKKI
jgi:hypothetical protein